MFSASLINTTTFPTACCKEPIPLSITRDFLAADMVHAYEAKVIEQATPKKVHCSDRYCERFIPPEFVDPEEAYYS
jgi:E3 ubiquitin-protein ligase RNF144